VNLIRPDASSEVAIKINEEDLERARKVLERFKKETGNFSFEETGVLKILLPVDFSEYSDNACSFAIGLSRKFPAVEIHLLYAYYLPDFSTVPYSEPMVYQNQIAEQINGARERASQNMDHAVKKMRSEIAKSGLTHVKLHSSLIQGTPSESVLYFSDSYHPHLIIVGAKGKGAKKDFLGSSSHKIVLNSSFPVLVIPEDSRSEQLKEPYKIAYATDFDESDFMAIRKLMRLMSTLKSEIFCIHHTEKDIEEKKKLKMDGLRSYFADHYPEIPLHCELLKTDSFFQAMDRFIKEHDIGILAVTTHKRNIISALIKPSLTKKLYYHSSIPLLVFHAEI
jgi:nucleotide-binding universal stress UspA family protein